MSRSRVGRDWSGRPPVKDDPCSVEVNRRQLIAGRFGVDSRPEKVTFLVCRMTEISDTITKSLTLCGEFYSLSKFCCTLLILGVYILGAVVDSVTLNKVPEARLFYGERVIDHTTRRR